MNRRGLLVGLGLLALVTSAYGKDFTFSGSRWNVAAPGVLLDSSTALQWTRQDNGGDINWNDAMQYCNNLALAGGGWRLPRADELEAIYDANVPSPKACWQNNGHSFICKVSPLFHLTGAAFWSGEQNGSSEAWYVILLYGQRPSDSVSYSNTKRALCARRS